MTDKKEERYYITRDEKAQAKYKELAGVLPDYVDDFLRGKKFAWSTRVEYAYSLIEFFNFWKENNPALPRDIGKISPDYLDMLSGQDILEYQKEIRDRTGKSSTLNNKLCAVRSLLKHMYAKDILENNISPKVELDPIKEADKPPIVALTKDEVGELLHIIEFGSPFPPRKQATKDKTRKRDLAIIAVLLYTGIRVSECVGINIEDLDIGNYCIRNIHRKGGKDEYGVYFKDNCRRYLEEYLEERYQISKDKISPGSTAALFLSENSKGEWNRISVRSIERLVEDYNSVCPTTKHITPHKFRSTYATSLGKLGDLQLLKENLGHTNIQMSQRYCSFDRSRQEKSRNSLDY